MSSVVIPVLTALIFAISMWMPRKGIGFSIFITVAMVLAVANVFWAFSMPRLMLPLSGDVAVAIYIAACLSLLVVLGLFFRKMKLEGRI
jgi:hypothetical protein